MNQKLRPHAAGHVLLAALMAVLVAWVGSFAGRDGSRLEERLGRVTEAIAERAEFDRLPDSKVEAEGEVEATGIEREDDGDGATFIAVLSSPWGLGEPSTAWAWKTEEVAARERLRLACTGARGPPLA